jgi:hypothetical protein
VNQRLSFVESLNDLRSYLVLDLTVSASFSLCS